MQKSEKTNQEETLCQSKTSITALAQTFGNDTELLELFDDMINRIIQAYSGTTQELSFLAGDCDFLHQLKKAIKTELLHNKPLTK